MTDKIENPVLEHLRFIRAEMSSIKDDVREIKSRVNTLEAGQATIIQQIGHLTGMAAEQHVKYDRLLERIERLMETLWDSLVRDQNNMAAIPAWHEKVLTDRAHLLDSGLEKASPWIEAKQRIRDTSTRSTR